ncbi:MAG: polysaccharide deacetylase [Rhodospirillaceae bacterium]|nr:polysaccharide deacetylase [Rhodospirillaceae bacterium]
MQYPFIPPQKRKPLIWPDKKRLVVQVTLNLEYWDMLKDTDSPYYAGGPAVIPDPIPGRILDVPNFSWREYGQRVGIWRILDTFDAIGVPASCTLNAKLGLERKDIVDAIIKRGWELVAHNYEQGDLLTNYQEDIEAEEELILRALNTYNEIVGKSAKGWLSSSLRSTPNTPEILAKNGISFLCDFMNDEQPYLMQTNHGPLVSIPYSVEINDFTFFHRRGMSTTSALEVLKEQFDQLYSESASTGKIMSVGLHPHVSGHPYRIRAIREFLEYANSYSDVWWATREQVADWYLKNHDSHINQ